MNNKEKHMSTRVKEAEERKKQKREKRMVITVHRLLRAPIVT